MSERLTITTPSEREILMTRRFAAPRALVFEALTRPELVKRWMGPREWPLVVCEIDLREGGRYRFEAEGPGGVRMGWGGVYREIVAPERIVQSEVFDEPWYPGEALVTITLSERDGRTTLEERIRYQSREARDMVLASPMEGGVSESFERLEELLAARDSA